MQENKSLSDRDFCEIIQMACPYDHFCDTCRLHTDYEKAREKSAEMMKNAVHILREVFQNPISYNGDNIGGRD